MFVKVSVIVPMYNVALFANSCMAGLICQSLKDFEIIFVDDCSTDNTFEIISSLAISNGREDVRFKLIHHQKNQGVACARNTGLENAEGEYIYFVDADDRIESDTLERLYGAAKSIDADISGCEWYITFSRNERHIHQINVNTGKELFSALSHGLMRWNLWLYMVRRTIYEENHFRFLPGMNMGEDMMQMMRLSLVSEKVVIIHHPLYHYIQTNSDAQTKKWTTKSRDQVSSNVAEVERFCQSISYDCSTELDFLKLNLKLPFIISDRDEDYEVWKNWFPEVNSSISENRNLPFRTKFIQKAANRGQFWIVRLYYWLVIKFIYGVLYQ